MGPFQDFSYPTGRAVLTDSAMPQRHCGFMKLDAAGFSLIELLASLTVLGLLVAVGVPSFSQMLERQRIEAVMLRLETGITMARTAAMARRTQVVVCPRDGLGECQPGLDWSHGWMLLIDDGQPHPLWIQQVSADSANTMHVSASRPLLRYRPDGTSVGSNLTLSLCLRGQVVAQQVVSNSGRVRRQQATGGQACPGA